MTTNPTGTTLSTFTASDGDNLAVQDWPLPDGRPLRGVVLLVHGLGEHAGRYEGLAHRLNTWGFAVRGYDQCGHGESGGARGTLPSSRRLVDDLTDLVDSTRGRMASGQPLIVLGHSLGGLVAACFVALRLRRIEGLVLSSPALNPGLGLLQKLLLAVLGRIAPNLAVGNGLDPDFLSHDVEVVRAYRSDPRVHDRISGRLARFIAGSGPFVLHHAPRWSVPTLLLYAGSDRLVDPRGSRDFVAAAPAASVTAHCFENLYHEIFNEVDSAPVAARLRHWLDAHF